MERTKLIVFLAVLITMALCLTIFMVDQKKNPSSDPVVTTQGTTQGQNEKPNETNGTTNTVETTMETTEATTEATTEETTEATTEATTVPTTIPPAEPNELGAEIAAFARELLGMPYVYGTAGPDSFDSSGLTYYCYKMFDISIPRSVQAQADGGVPVSKEDLQPGDLVFFNGDTPGKPQICGIYIGNNKFVGAFNSSRPVTEVDMSTSYYLSHYECARRYY